MFVESHYLTATEVPFVTDQMLSVGNTATLTMGANTAIKFMAGASIQIDVGGSLTMPGTCVFTSYRDDTVKGDTDGPTTPGPATGDWIGLWDSNLFAGSGDWVTGANIRYALNVWL